MVPLIMRLTWSGEVSREFSSRRVFASNIDFLRMEPKSFRLHRTEGANNHIKQDDTVFFARNPIGVYLQSTLRNVGKHGS